MKTILNGLHPSFEALSACSDMNDVDRAASKVSRHVAQCAQCRDAVEQIREMGHSARHEAAGRMPADLWSRIETSAKRATAPRPRETPLADADVWQLAPGLKPTSSWPTSPTRAWTAKRWVGVGVAAAAVVVVALAWPSDRSLEATGTSRLTFSPSRPIPGGVLKVRYTAAQWLKGAPKLVLVGRGLGTPAFGGDWTLGDSLAVLLPAGSGTYAAELRLPSDFMGTWLSVSDSAGKETDSDNLRPWVAIGGGLDGKPSHASLLVAAENVGNIYDVRGDVHGAMSPRQSVDPSDSLRRYFPKSPAGWAFARPPEGKGTLFERLVAFFNSSERKYMSFYNELWPQKNVDAELMYEMSMFGANIQEPDEEIRWARRLATEHPDDPRAFRVLLASLHQVELKQPVGLRDSMQPWLPILDEMYAKVAAGEQPYEVMQFMSRYADSGTVERWRIRVDSASGFRFWDDDALKDANRRRRAVAFWIGETRGSCVRPSGKYPFGTSGESWVARCQRERISTFTRVARVRLIDGDNLGARAFVDSAEQIPLVAENCGRRWSARAYGAIASMRLGDTVRAERELIAEVGIWPNGPYADSARRWMSARVNSPRFTASVDSVRRVFLACEAGQRLDRQARRKRYQSAN